MTPTPSTSMTTPMPMAMITSLVIPLLMILYFHLTLIETRIHFPYTLYKPFQLSIDLILLFLSIMLAYLEPYL